ncbi:MAG: cation:proton antiporter, partial [Gammaproteobacteria bacterium]|nr:cation:proton antiporter [Gammaproteobacteria bacterium]
METFHTPSAQALLVIGTLLGMTLVVRGLLFRAVLPPLLVYLTAGGVLGWWNAQDPWLDSATQHSLTVLAEAGLVMLMFKVGLESDIRGMLSQLRAASWIWLWNVVISGGAGFCVALYALEFSLLTSAFIGVALTATSLGVSVAIWQDAGRLHSPEGNLLVDVAELDDISSIVLMTVLVASAPLLLSGEGNAWVSMGSTLLQVLGVLVVFVVGCGLFSVYVEQHLTHFVLLRSTNHEPMILILAVGFVIAALAEISGLSLAIGAFLAGLAFSRDTEAAKERVVFQGLYDFFTPFFFISLGLLIEPEAFDVALWAGAALLVVAVLGKVIGTGLPARRRLGGYGALLIGVSMVPR